MCALVHPGHFTRMNFPPEIEVLNLNSQGQLEADTTSDARATKGARAPNDMGGPVGSPTHPSLSPSGSPVHQDRSTPHMSTGSLAPERTEVRRSPSTKHADKTAMTKSQTPYRRLQHECEAAGVSSHGTTSVLRQRLDDARSNAATNTGPAKTTNATQRASDLTPGPALPRDPNPLHETSTTPNSRNKFNSATYAGSSSSSSSIVVPAIAIKKRGPGRPKRKRAGATSTDLFLKATRTDPEHSQRNLAGATADDGDAGLKGTPRCTCITKHDNCRVCARQEYTSRATPVRQYSASSTATLEEHRSHAMADKRVTTTTSVTHSITLLPFFKMVP